MEIMKYNEDSRVKIPAIIHLTRLGFIYQSKVNTKIDTNNNIFTDIFTESIKRINNREFSEDVISSLIKEIYTLTDNAVDKGNAFFKRIHGYHKVKLIDFDDFYKNDFRVVTELQYQGERNSFRPDITLLINGMPMAFLEVKKPNNSQGIQAEFNRMKDRTGYKDCTHFFNQLQVLGFSNNQSYNDNEKVRLQGSFYTTPNGTDLRYNLFREEQEIHVNEYVDDELVNRILLDTQSLSIAGTSEFLSNMKVSTPCNKFITSVFSIERLMFLLQYGLVYVNSLVDGYNKHIIRYPQFFGVENVISLLDKSALSKGVLWLTPGCGKTELSYYLTNVLRDYFQAKGIVTKFYFIVDRLDLLIQASSEFTYRGMTIAKIENKADFANNIGTSRVVGPEMQQGTYLETMNCVNIQRFCEEAKVDIKCADRVQRIYFIDEVHRSYRKSGEFLANLLGIDAHGIFIGLTGTPLLKEDFRTTDIFEKYIYKYYYNKSIADGYTLRIKKENIAMQFKNDVKALLGIPEEKSIPKSTWNDVTSRPEFVNALGKYINDDFKVFRSEVFNDPSLGFMIVAATSDQARLMHSWFEQNTSLRVALVLHTEEDNKLKQEGFRGIKNKETGKMESTYDGVIVFAMLLTGFDAPRLKRLYLLRELRDHNLLQTLARVNRPYKKMQYGYVVDFVDITEEYEEINQRYLDELKEDIKDEDDSVDIDGFFVDVQKAKDTIREITTNNLFGYMHNIEGNLEDFAAQLEYLEEQELREIRNNLIAYKEAYNELRMSHEDVSGIPIERINKAYNEVNNRIKLRVYERNLDNDTDIEEIDFSELIVEFLKINEIELSFDMGNDILEKISSIQNALSSNCDKKDKEYLDLYKALKAIIKRFKTEVRNVKDIDKLAIELDKLYKQIVLLNNKNTELTKIYKGNESCMRIHKRLVQQFIDHFNASAIYDIMTEIMVIITETLCHLYQPSEAVVKRDMRRPIGSTFKKHGYPLSPTQIECIVYLFLDEMFTN